MLGSMLLLSVGLVLQVGGAGDDRLFHGCVYGAIVLLSGGALVGGYASGRRPQPEQPDPAAWRRTVRSVAWVTLSLAIMLAAPLLDGVSLEETAARLATGFLRFGGPAVAAWLVGYVIGRRVRDGRSPASIIATVALGGLLAVALWGPLVASVAALQGQEVDTGAPDFVPPNLATTVALSGSTQLTAGAPTRMVATVENRGSGAVLATVKLLIPSTFSEPVVRAPDSFWCTVRTFTSDHVVTCEGGTVARGAPVTITAELHAPTASGTYVVGAVSDLRLGFEDPDGHDNTAGVAVTVR
jgi:hypothetical protein